MPDFYYTSRLSGDEIEHVLENPVLTTTQALTSSQQAIARNNINAVPVPSPLGQGYVIMYNGNGTWIGTPIHEIPSGGTTGQVLKKTSDTNYAVEWGSVAGGVESVNGETGAVVLTASDVGALPDTTTAGDLGAIEAPDSPNEGDVLVYASGAWSADALDADAVGAIASPSSPSPGDVLTYANGAWTASAPATELPSVTTTDNGKVLSVVQGSWAAAMPDPGLPTVSTSDNGKVLKVVSGDWEASTITASEVGAIATPSTAPTTGQFLQWNGVAWVAASLPLYNGGVS